MVPLLIARQVLARFSPNRARSRHLRGRTVHASPTAFPAVICDIPPRHQAVVGVRGAGRLGGGWRAAQKPPVTPPVGVSAIASCYHALPKVVKKIEKIKQGSTDPDSFQSRARKGWVNSESQAKLESLERRQTTTEAEATDGSNSSRYYHTRLSRNPSSRVNYNER